MKPRIIVYLIIDYVFLAVMLISLTALKWTWPSVVVVLVVHAINTLSSVARAIE